MSKPTIVMANDHAAFELKHILKDMLIADGFSVTDLGTEGAGSVDYPDYGHKAAQAVLEGGEGTLGIILCGTGIGISIAANRHAGIRAALCHNTTEAALTRQHNDANILAIGARMLGVEVAKDITRTCLTTAFEGGRHARRVGKLDQS
ncbi:MAG: ribose 5-phosphate isomerase B [Alphaproteobacteria bacterium]